MPQHYEAWRTVLLRHGMHFEEGRFYQTAGRPVKELVSQLAAEQGVIVDADSIAQERDAYFHSLGAAALRPVAVVVDIARRFRGAVPLAVATGSTRISAEASLRAIGTLEWFDAVISSDDGGRSKPAPDVFLLAAKAIAIPPTQCVVFEDADAGIEGAQRAGMWAVDIREWLQR